MIHSGRRVLRIGLLLCVLLLSSSLASAQGFRPEAMALPLQALGLSDPNAQRILQQHAMVELSRSFELKSEREVLAARDRAIDRISSEECTEEACIRVMGELLDVEYTFRILITASGDFWDLTGIRSEPLGPTVRKNLACEQCTLSKARRLLTELLLGLRPGEAVAGSGEAVLVLDSEPRGQVFINGVAQGQTPLEVSVSTESPVDVLVVAEGYTDFARVYEGLRSGERLQEDIRLVRKRTLLRVESEPPGAEIWLNGAPQRNPDGSVQTTPGELRPEYGELELELRLARYETFRTTLEADQRDLGVRRFPLQPKPGRLVIRVPGKYRDAEIRIDGSRVGEMEGEIAKAFRVPALKRLELQAVAGENASEVQTVTVPPDGSATVSFEDFEEAQPEEPTRSSSSSRWKFWTGGASAGFAYSPIFITLNENELQEINLSYGVSGADLQVGHIALQLMSAEGQMTDRYDRELQSFYYSDGTSIREVTETNARVVRLLYTAWEPGWMGSFGVEQTTLNFLTATETKTARFTNPVMDLGYRWNWTRWFLSLRYRLSFTFGTVLGDAISNGFVFATGFRFGP